MSMGSPGDSPLTDLLKWDQPSEFPQDVTLMLLRLNEEFPNSNSCSIYMSRRETTDPLLKWSWDFNTGSTHSQLSDEIIF